jgi:hypothetical protein
MVTLIRIMCILLAIGGAIDIWSGSHVFGSGNDLLVIKGWVVVIAANIMDWRWVRKEW